MRRHQPFCGSFDPAEERSTTCGIAFDPQRAGARPPGDPDVKAMQYAAMQYAAIQHTSIVGGTARWPPSKALSHHPGGDPDVHACR